MGIDQDSGANSSLPRPTLAMPLLPMTCITANKVRQRNEFRDGTLGTSQGTSHLHTQLRPGFLMGAH